MRCSRKYLVSNILWRRGGGARFSAENYLPHSSEKFRKATRHCFTMFPVSKNFRDKRGGDVTILRRKRFCLTEPKNFVGEPFSVSLFLGIDKFSTSEGCVTILCQKFVVSQCHKFSLQTPLVFH